MVLFTRAGFFFIVPPSGESQLKPNSIDDKAEEDFSLKLLELADRLDSDDVGVRLNLPETWLSAKVPPLQGWQFDVKLFSHPSDI